MAGLPKGFRRGLLVGGVIAFLWTVLGNRRRRTSIAAWAIGRLETVPFPATRIYSWAAGRLMRDVYRAVAEDVVSEARSGELLELGGGPGYLAVEMAARARDLQITAMDLSGDMVLLAESRVHYAGLGKQVKVIHGDAKDIPFEDGSFDFVVSLGGLHHWIAPELVLSEVYRVLKRGGKAWIYDVRRETPEEAWEVARQGLPALLRPLFDTGIVGSWRSARSEGEIGEIVAKSPFKRAKMGAMEAEIGDVTLPALTRVALKK